MNYPVYTDFISSKKVLWFYHFNFTLLKFRISTFKVFTVIKTVPLYP